MMLKLSFVLVALNLSCGSWAAPSPQRTLVGTQGHETIERKYDTLSTYRVEPLVSTLTQLVAPVAVHHPTVAVKTAAVPVTQVAHVPVTQVAHVPVTQVAHVPVAPVTHVQVVAPAATHYAPVATHYTPVSAHYAPLATHYAPLAAHYAPLATRYAPLATRYAHAVPTLARMYHTGPLLHQAYSHVSTWPHGPVLQSLVGDLAVAPELINEAPQFSRLADNVLA